MLKSKRASENLKLGLTLIPQENWDCDNVATICVFLLNQTESLTLSWVCVCVGGGGGGGGVILPPLLVFPE